MLTYLLAWLARPDFRVHPARQQGASGPWLDWRDDESKPGDLVICRTSWRHGAHPFAVGYVVEMYSRSDVLLRELGGRRLCRMSNEGFYAVRGMSERHHFELLPGRWHRFYCKVIKAFQRGQSYSHLFDSVEFHDDGTATIWVREKWDGRGKDENGQPTWSKPYPVTMRWNSRTTIKAILAAMREAGYGEREFEREPDQKPSTPETGPGPFFELTGKL
jgi:hypothetical protein